jgi:Large ribosomal RNA subunit accumulation protein YceD
MTDGRAPAPEFSRLVDVAALEGGEVVRRIEAGPAEREALVRRLRLNALASLKATIRLRQRSDRVVELRGGFTADLAQVCVVSLEPVPARIEQSFEQIYSADVRDTPGAVVVWMDEEDAPEPLSGDRIDIGEAVVQQLAVALDPYPRKPGAEIPPEYSAEAGAGARDNPFAALAPLRRS